MEPEIKIDDIIKEAKIFSKQISKSKHDVVRGITDGKSVGTHLEHEFKKLLEKGYAVDKIL